MKDKFVLDSSLWIEIERKNEAVLKRAEPLIQANEICLVDVITAEVLRGVKTRKDFETLKKAFNDFPQISTDWPPVAELAFSCARKGFHPPLVDLYIAQAVREHKKTLLTQDRHFAQISRVKPFRFEMI